jgi:hypothetical protein
MPTWTTNWLIDGVEIEENASELQIRRARTVEVEALLDNTEMRSVLESGTNPWVTRGALIEMRFENVARKLLDGLALLYDFDVAVTLAIDVLAPDDVIGYSPAHDFTGEGLTFYAPYRPWREANPEEVKVYVGGDLVENGYTVDHASGSVTFDTPQTDPVTLEFCWQPTVVVEEFEPDKTAGQGPDTWSGRVVVRQID